MADRTGDHFRASGLAVNPDQTHGNSANWHRRRALKQEIYTVDTEAPERTTRHRQKANQ